MAQNWAEHHASATVNAPTHQVYGLFSHFNDFPKFMSFVKEVTYYDAQRSHWVADIVGRHEWDAQNQDWVENRQIGWRSYNGLENTGKVTFQTVGPMQTVVDVYISYNPPAGILGDLGERLGAGSRFENALQQDLDNFARMVDQAPPGALDPESSNYLFHSGSAAAKGTTTDRQNAAMGNEPNEPGVTSTTGGYTAGTTTGTPEHRPVTDQDIINEPTGAPVTPGTPISNRDVMGGPDTGITRNPVMPPENTDPGTRNPDAE